MKDNSYNFKKLLRLAAEDSGINEKLFAGADEDVKNSLLYKVSKKVYNGELIPPENYDLCLNTEKLGYEGTKDLIMEYVKRRTGK